MGRIRLGRATGLALLVAPWLIACQESSSAPKPGASQEQAPTSVKAFSAGRSIGVSSEPTETEYPFRDQLELTVTGPSGAKEALDAQREALVECAYALSPDTKQIAMVEAKATLKSDGALENFELTKYADSTPGKACITRCVLGASMPKGVAGELQLKLAYSTKP
ncbi:MAG: hypothetical protein H6718_27630 [Polyangiaceae bacterium]|nr:hypothetical protein [Myxococcales bacterium]MCB9589216.1 hypothetical protein [Polyangiaceae bacterium]